MKVNEIVFFSFTYLASCTFEESYPPLCNYKLGGNRFKWLVGSGRTPSLSTGPSNDHTLGDSRGNEDIAKCYRWLHVQVTDLKNTTGSSNSLFFDEPVLKPIDGHLEKPIDGHLTCL